MHDNKREGYNGGNDFLYANLTNVEGTGNRMDLVSNGFKHRTSDDSNNGLADSYIYMAFAENPLVGTNNIPATAR